MLERNTSQPVPLNPPHRPMERRLNEEFVINPKQGEAKPIVPLHSDSYGKLAVGGASEVVRVYYERLEDLAYI